MNSHVSRLAIEWAHCDSAGIAFYPHFYVWFDQATERLFKANGLGYAELESDFGIHGMPLVETGATYRNPCRLGEEVLLTSWVEAWSGRSFVVNHSVTHADGRPALDGFERRAMVVPAPDSPRGIKAVEIPPAIMDRFTG